MYLQTPEDDPTRLKYVALVNIFVNKYTVYHGNSYLPFTCVDNIISI